MSWDFFEEEKTGPSNMGGHTTSHTTSYPKRRNSTTSHITKRSKKIPEISFELINKFLIYIESLDPSEYPLQAPIIKQIKKYHKSTTISQVLMLFQQFLKEEKI